MTYLLDTNVCIELLNERDTLVSQKLASVVPQTVRLCSVVIAELYHGAHKSNRREANLALLRRFCAQFESLPFDDDAAQVYGRLRAGLEKQGMLIGPHDLLIAAIAVARDVTLVTRNTAEFGRVPDLALENWQT
jgi:tRNA(fMet)-specific endonuclease VapC